jgi:endonuclease-3
MNKQEKVAWVMAQLERLYPHPPVPLDHRNPFELLIAVLLSAQCTDARVNLVTPALFSAGPDPASMQALGEDKIRDFIRSCGLAPAKAANIHRLCGMLLDLHGGEVPDSFEALEALPGVGHKTASVVMAQAFGVPAFPVDTHIHRLMWRWGFSDGSSVEKTEKDAKRLFPRERWNDLHLQIIFYGREYSPARGVKWEKDFILREIGRAEERRKWAG